MDEDVFINQRVIPKMEVLKNAVKMQYNADINKSLDKMNISKMNNNKEKAL